MKRMCTFIAAVSLIVTACVTVIASGQQAGTATGKLSKKDAETIAAVRAVLDAQILAWNRGDIEGFMDGYARSDEIVFVSGDTVTLGWQTVLDRYKKNYDSREKMGRLAFTELETKLLNSDTAVVIGRWQLTRERDAPQGRFTLIFRRAAPGWRIIHDHTSSAS